MITFKHLIISFAVFCSCNNTPHAKKHIRETASESRSDIKSILQKADSVIITGHSGRALKMLKANGTMPPVPPVLINGRPNYTVIKKQLLLKSDGLNMLAETLSKATQPAKLTKCDFDPHHSIFIFINGRVSYIDMCFQCLQHETSKDIETTFFLDEEQYGRLKMFFIERGVYYDATLDLKY